MTKNTPTTAAKAVIFDMDGVLVDNHSFHVQAWKEFCQQHNRPLNEQEFTDHINGRSVREAVVHLFGSDLSEEKIHALGEEKEALYRKLYAPHLKPTPGLETFINRLQQAQWRLAIATSADTRNLNFTLAGLGFAHYFPHTVDSSGVRRGKPAPDLYLKAADVLELHPKRCIVFEDSKAGIAAAQAAGMPVIAISTTHSRQELEPTGVQLIIDSFEEIDPDQLHDLLQAHA